MTTFVHIISSSLLINIDIMRQYIQGGAKATRHSMLNNRKSFSRDICATLYCLT